MNDKTQNTQDLKNSDFLAWRVGNYQRIRREEQIKRVFAARDRDRHPIHH
jgi:hypothetical protein